MPNFHNIKDLIATPARGEKLVFDLFEKRKKISYKIDEALQITGIEEDTIQKLQDKGVVINGNGSLELDDVFLTFFEQMVDVNEDITASNIHDQIKQIREEYIRFYQNAQTVAARQNFLKQMKKSLQKINKSISKAIKDLCILIHDNYTVKVI